MTPDSLIKLVSELLDLPLYDNEGKYCGVVDDVELSGGPGKELKLKAPDSSPTSQNMTALITNANRPNVAHESGRVSMVTIGRIRALTIASSVACTVASKMGSRFSLARKNVRYALAASSQTGLAVEKARNRSHEPSPLMLPRRANPSEARRATRFS